MTHEELELMRITCFRQLAMDLAQSMIEDPSQLYGGNSTPEQQAAYYHACCEAAEHYDQLLGQALGKGR